MRGMGQHGPRQRPTTGAKFRQLACCTLLLRGLVHGFDWSLVG